MIPPIPTEPMAARTPLLALARRVASTAPAHASGSYPPNPPRLGGAALAKIDARAYTLGKTLFTDRLTLPAESPPGCDPAANLEILRVIQDRLPERVASEIDLPSLAPRLDTEQVNALIYYVGIRFRIAPDSVPR